MSDGNGNEPTHIDLRGVNGLVIATVPILRTLTLRGITGFCIHEYEGEFRVSHIETGAYLSRGSTDGEAFVIARRSSREELEIKIRTVSREIERLIALNQRGN